MGTSLKEMKDKPLPKSLREKKRYVAFQVYGENVDTKALAKTLHNAAAKVLGTLRMAEAGISLITYAPDTKRGIMRVHTKYVDHAKASLLFIQEIDNQKVIIRSLASSGMLKKAKQVCG